MIRTTAPPHPNVVQRCRYAEAGEGPGEGGLDGFDLGIGVLSLFVRGGERRGIMMASLSSVWDANETWLVVLGGALFGAFPIVYGIVLNALYLPVIVMIFALIFRGVAFEFREHSRQRLWDFAFGVGSLRGYVSMRLGSRRRRTAQHDAANRF